MRTKFKVIAVVFVVFFVAVALIGYTILQRIEKHKRAQKIADRVMEQLDQRSVLQEFPKDFFPRDGLVTLLDSVATNCNWPKRDGMFVDFSTQENIGGMDEISFVYEYYLSCDSLRYIVAFGLEEEEPVLMKFEVEPIELESHHILKKGKHLKYNRR